MSLPFPNKTIHQIFEEQVERAPEKTALIFEEQKLTYRELNVRANRLARYLTTHHNIRPDTLIAMSLKRGIDCIVSMLAILKSGAAYVPLDPGYPQERLRFMLQDTNADIILTQEDLVQNLPTENKSVVLVDRGLHNDFPVSNLYTMVHPEHLAYVLYTSGTTGRSKGVMVEHRNVVQLVKNQTYFDLNSHDVIAQSSNINFDAATFEIWGALLNGIALSVLPCKTILSSQLLKAAIQKADITIVTVTSALFDQLVRQDATLFSNLKYLFVVGDVLNVSTVDQVLMEKEHRPQAILNGYGPTETTTFATTYRVPDAFKTEEQAVPIGLPLCHTQIHILDDGLQPVPRGAVGELYIGGAGVARGYLNLPDVTEQKFITNPFATADDRELGRNLSLYRSGDLARYLPDGNIEFMGRRDQQLPESKDLGGIQKYSELNKDEATESETLILRDYLLSEFKPTYNDSFVVELNQPASFGNFHHAVEAVLSECEVLHTNYMDAGDRFLRRINNSSAIENEYLDVSHCADPDAEFLDRIDVLVKKEFNICQDKLIRFYLFKLNRDKYRIFVVFFLTLLDATSINVLCRKLLERMGLEDTGSVAKLRDSYMRESKIATGENNLERKMDTISY